MHCAQIYPMTKTTLILATLLTLGACFKAHAVESNLQVESPLSQQQSMERISLSELNRHHWQISKINNLASFQQKEKSWIFSFPASGKYKAFGICNIITGSFNAGDNGAFRLGKLETPTSECPESKDEEAMVFNLLLLADNFAIRRDLLILKSANQVLLELSPSDQEINAKIPTKSHSKKPSKSKKSNTRKLKSEQSKATKGKPAKTVKHHASKQATVKSFKKTAQKKVQKK